VLDAGLPVSEGISLMGEEEDDDDLKAMLDRLYERLGYGTTVFAAFTEEGVFPEYMLNMIDLGEQTGHLATVFHKLAAYYDKQVHIRSVIRSAVAYPAMLFVIILAVFFVFLTEVLPVFKDVFAQLGATMPPFATALLNFGIGLGKAKWVLLGVLVAVLVYLILCRTVRSVRDASMNLLTRLFGGSALGLKVSLARFAAAMNLSYSGLSDVQEALAMSERFSSSKALEEKIRRCHAEIEAGKGVAEAMSASDLFSSIDCKMLSIGAKTGCVDEVLETIAVHTEEDMDEALEKATGRVEPVIVLILSVCVGLLLLTVMLPLVSIMSVI